MEAPQTAGQKGETYRHFVTFYRPARGSTYSRLPWIDPVTGKRRERKGGTTLAGARAEADEIVAQLMAVPPPESARANLRARDGAAGCP